MIVKEVAVDNVVILWIVRWVYFSIVQYSECTLVRSQKLTLR
jgi:hypothetical protein